MKLGIAAVAVLALIVAACAAAGDATTVPEFTVTGVVNAGPTCPVMQDPPDPDCADRPVAGAELLARDATGNRIAATTTDDRGTFELLLPAGNYTLEPQPHEGLLGTAEPQPFTVDSTTTTHLTVLYDTGIR